MSELDRFILGPRSCVRPGSRVRLSGGPTFRGARCATMRGTWVVRHIWQGRRERVYLEVARVENGMLGACYLAFVAGKPHRNTDLDHWINRPYRVRLLKRAAVAHSFAHERKR